MTIKLSTTIRNKQCDACVDVIDTGTTNAAGKFEIRTGSKPANPQTAVSGTLLATVVMPNPAFGTSSGGTATANTISSVSAVATGTAGWFRLYDRDNNALIDGDITATGGGGDMTFDTVSFISGGTVAISSMTYTVVE